MLHRRDVIIWANRPTAHLCADLAGRARALMIALTVAFAQSACSKVDTACCAETTESAAEALEHGRMMFSLSHSGRETITDRLSLAGGRVEFDIDGVVVDEHPILNEEPRLESTSVAGLVLGDDEFLKPSRALVIVGTDRKTWRFDYSVLVGKADITPPMRELIGHRIRLFARQVVWGVTPAYGATITDARGLVLALDSGALEDTQHPDLAITRGPRIEVSGALGGDSRLQMFSIGGAKGLLLAPGQCDSILLSEGKRWTCNLWSTYWHHHDRITDVVNEITWATWLEHSR